VSTGGPGRALEPHLTFVSLGVEDLVRAVRFYRDALGLPAREVGEGMAVLDLGAARLALLPRQALAREAGIAAGPPPGPDGGFPGILHSLNVHRREEVASLLARAAAGGARVVRPAAPASWGGETGVFADPDGFLWEIAWNPRLPPA